MTDDDFFTKLISVLSPINGPIKQTYRDKSVQEDGYVYVHKVLTSKVGFQGRKYTFENDAFTIDEKSIFAPLIQFTCFDYDRLVLLSMQLQSINVINDLRSLGLKIERITQIRIPYNMDNSNNFRVDANFDVVFTYDQTITATTPKALPVAEIHRV